MKGKKAQGLATDKMIILVLVALVIIASLVFLFRSNIQSWIQLIPGFEDTSKTAKYADKCPVKIAEISKSTIVFCNQQTKNCDVISKLQIDGNNIQAHYTNMLVPDANIGQISGNLLIIYSEIINREGKLFTSVKSDIPDYYYTLNLNGAYLYSKTEICRDEIVKEQTKFTPEEKIGTLSYKSDWYALGLNGKNEISSYNQISGEKYSNIFIDKDNFIYFDGFTNTRVGVRNPETNIISIYALFIASEPSGVIPSGYLKQLNGAEIVTGEIYKKTTAK